MLEDMLTRALPAPPMVKTQSDIEFQLLLEAYKKGTVSDNNQHAEVIHSKMNSTMQITEMIQEAREKAETMMHNAKATPFNEPRMPRNKALSETLKAKNKTDQFVIMK